MTLDSAAAPRDALVLATTDAPVGAVLQAAITSAVATCGAGAGAILDADHRTRAAADWASTDLDALLAHNGITEAHLLRGEPWPEEPLVFRVNAQFGALAVSGVLALAPLRAGGSLVGGLLLHYPEADGPDARRREQIARSAAVAALVLENERLNEESRRARHARDHFLTAIHHELRTPATAIMLRTGLLRSGLVASLPPPLQKTIATLEADVTELIRVAGNVLDLAALEGGMFPARTDLVHPRRLIIDLLRKVEPTAERKGLTLSVFLPRALPILQTDAERLGRILLHLLGNAVKYTDEGRVEVRVERATRETASGHREPILLVRISDTGRGIPEGEGGRIFEPFAQVEEGARTDSPVRGIGLGLPLARKLARSIGGEVTLQPRERRGTVAVLVIPYRGVTKA